MNTPIVRIYRSAQQASEAQAKLKGWGFSDDVIGVVTGAGSTEATVAAITAHWVLRDEARIYARTLASGGTLVCIRAPFGTARIATELLDSCGPVDSGVSETRSGGWEDAAPFSSAIGFPTLSKGATPFTSFWGLTMRLSSGTTFGGFLPELSDSNSSFTGGFMPLLSESATPLSSMLGLPLLI